jgi:hypothetical protein
VSVTPARRRRRVLILRPTILTLQLQGTIALDVGHRGAPKVQIRPLQRPRHNAARAECDRLGGRCARTGNCNPQYRRHFGDIPRLHWLGNGFQAGELFRRPVPADRFKALTASALPRAGTVSLGSSPTRDDFRTTRVGLPKPNRWPEPSVWPNHT